MKDPDQRLLETLCLPPYEIPALSDSVMRVLRTIDDEKSGAQDVADAIVSDPPLAARVLSLANSSIYNPLGPPCDELRDAVSRLGLEELRGIVVATGVVETFSNLEGPFSQSAFWKHSITSGIAAGAVAECAEKIGPMGRPGENPFFIAGLLHDIGVLALLWFQGARYLDVLDESRREQERLIDCERRAFGANHAQVGAALIRTWGLPEHLAQSARHHHEPQRANPEWRGWAHVVHLSDWISHNEGHGVTVDGYADPFDPESWVELGIDRDRMPELIDDFREATEQADTLLQLIKS